MPTKKPKQVGSQVRAYLSARPPAVRRDLKTVRDAIRAVAPGAVESFGYGIPGFKLDGKTLIWYAAWKHHLSPYPMTAVVKRALRRDDLEGHEISKGTIRFPLDKPPPLTLVKRIVEARVAELKAG